MNADPVEQRRAFTGLLAAPVINRRSHPELWPLVWRHRTTLTDWFNNRLGYRLIVTDTSARLFRLPLDGWVTAPVRYRPPSRRVLVLAILAAAAAEDTEDLTTTQDLSDRVRQLAAHEDVRVGPYDPDRFADRMHFTKAVDLLRSVGVLWPTGRADAERSEQWAHHADKVGGAYEVRRDLLLRMVDPAALSAALESGAAPDGTAAADGAADGGAAEAEQTVRDGSARFLLMRRLIELPVCLRADLGEAELAYLASQGHRLVSWCEEMTGWTAEQRAEGIALIVPEATDTDLPFPQLRALDFLALMLLDELLRTCGADRAVGRSGGGRFDEEALAVAVAAVRERHPKAVTNDLNDAERFRDATVGLLTALDLVRPVGPGWWRVMPVAARFRNPTVESVSARLELEVER